MSLTLTKSRALLARAEHLLPAGVNSPVRAFRSVGGDPPFIASGQGAWLQDVDGNRYVDYVLSWGPALLRRAHGGRGRDRRGDAALLPEP
jgi:glutamate-1-semialdehyde 2,1-aminomutase